MREPIVGYGLCHCGCGQATRIAKKTQRSEGRIQGQPARYVTGHGGANGPVAFWSHVDKTDGCWIWTGCIDRVSGYGYFGTARAHRLIFASHLGPIPTGSRSATPATSERASTRRTCSSGPTRTT
jgi:hypothetical protein